MLNFYDSMPGKNIIVRMADRLRAGKSDETKDVSRHAPIRCIVKPDADRPDRVMLVRAERVMTVRISPDTDYFNVGGFRLGKRFSANPAHLQSDDSVLLLADEASAAAFGTEVTAVDFLEDLVL